MLRNIFSLIRKKPQGRVFINYRRDDTQWFAGRLADSLSIYFGDKRVFRDIEGIAGGADFGEVIRGTLKKTDATIILIGGQWLSLTNADGVRRIDEPNDWVAQEVVTALNAGMPVYPVLVGDTPMPRSSELPESLRPMLRFNAISISDNRWDADIEKLAKIIGLDIPSQTERRLSGLNLLISLSMALSLLVCFFAIFRNLMCHIQLNNAQLIGAMPGEQSGWCSSYSLPDFNDQLANWPLHLNFTVIPFIVIPCCSALLFVFARLVDKTRRSWLLAAAWVGAVGTIAAFIALEPVPVSYEPLAMTLAASVIILSMFVLMCLSGFKAK